MGKRLRNRSPGQPTQTGAALAATLILVTAGTALALSALRSATTEAQLGGTLMAAQDAFWLAELGVAAGLNFALTRPTELPASGSMILPALTGSGSDKDHAEIIIHQGTADDHCPELHLTSTVRQHYEIHATGFADRRAITTNVQGFYICSEICTASDCAIQENPPVKSYWKTFSGGLSP
jgi:hypothetical protein